MADDDPETDRDPQNEPDPTRKRRWHLADDDLVAGFDESGGRPPGLRAFFAVTIGASLVIWELAFDLGAYHTVFYSRLFQILVVSTVLLLGSIVLRRIVRVRPWHQFLLAVPLLWLVVRFIAPLGHASRPQRVLDGILVALTLASVPFILWAVARIMSPEYFALPSRRLKIGVASIVVAVAVAGFLVGQFNNRFTTCQEYVVAGDDEPKNCSHALGPTQPFRPLPRR
ncbi:MAG TPA: hypothetical protein VGJ28_15945 [Micromonosporaceae bacterium]|jgi:hypothetical protein